MPEDVRKVITEAYEVSSSLLKELERRGIELNADLARNADESTAKIDLLVVGIERMDPHSRARHLQQIQDIKRSAVSRMNAIREQLRINRQAMETEDRFHQEQSLLCKCGMRMELERVSDQIQDETVKIHWSDT